MVCLFLFSFLISSVPFFSFLLSLVFLYYNYFAVFLFPKSGSLVLLFFFSFAFFVSLFSKSGSLVLFLFLACFSSTFLFGVWFGSVAHLKFGSLLIFNSDFILSLTALQTLHGHGSSTSRSYSYEVSE